MMLPAIRFLILLPTLSLKQRLTSSRILAKELAVTLTKIQIQERARRKRERIKTMFGLPTPHGTRPREHSDTGAPIFKPVPVPDFSSVFKRLLKRKGKP